MPAHKKLFSLDNATVEEIKRDRTKTRPRAIVENTEPLKITQRPALPPARYYVQTNNGRKPLENYNPPLEKDIQKLANQRQQMISRYIGKVLDEWTPEPPRAVLLFTEDKEGDRKLLNKITNPSPDFITKCEDYADKKQVDLSVHHPDGRSRWIPSLPPKDRQSYRTTKQPATLGCRRCGSITCAGVGSTGVPCNGKKHTTPAPAPAPVTPPAPVTKTTVVEDKPETVEKKRPAVDTTTPPMKHATHAWRRAAVKRNLDRGVFCFKKIAEFTGIPEEHVLPIFIEIQPDETQKKETHKT